LQDAYIPCTPPGGLQFETGVTFFIPERVYFNEQRTQEMLKGQEGILFKIMPQSRLITDTTAVNQCEIVRHIAPF
jgi:hypothetical protein